MARAANERIGADRTSTSAKMKKPTSGAGQAAYHKSNSGDVAENWKIGALSQKSRFSRLPSDRI
jgi:hypothetical protein